MNMEQEPGVPDPEQIPKIDIPLAYRPEVQRLAEADEDLAHRLRGLQIADALLAIDTGDAARHVLRDVMYAEVVGRLRAAGYDPEPTPDSP
jgi:hypothetical protein